MLEWPLLLSAGLLGSSHCVGMCGPFALAIGAGQRGWRRGLQRQLAYSGGRLFTYAVLGAVAGFGGLRLAQQVAPWVNAPAVLSILAGALLIIQGLVSPAAAGGETTVAPASWQPLDRPGPLPVGNAAGLLPARPRTP